MEFSETEEELIQSDRDTEVEEEPPLSVYQHLSRALDNVNDNGRYTAIEHIQNLHGVLKNLPAVDAQYLPEEMSNPCGNRDRHPKILDNYNTSDDKSVIQNILGFNVGWGEGDKLGEFMEKYKELKNEKLWYHLQYFERENDDEMISVFFYLVECEHMPADSARDTLLVHELQHSNLVVHSPDDLISESEIIDNNQPIYDKLKHFKRPPKGIYEITMEARAHLVWTRWDEAKSKLSEAMKILERLHAAKTAAAQSQQLIIEHLIQRQTPNIDDGMRAQIKVEFHKLEMELFAGIGSGQGSNGEEDQSPEVEGSNGEEGQPSAAVHPALLNFSSDSSSDSDD